VLAGSVSSYGDVDADARARASPRVDLTLRYAFPFQHVQKPIRTVLTITNKKKIGEFLIEVKMFYAYFKVFLNSPHTELLHFGEE